MFFSDMNTYPETYLHVTEMRFGKEWIVPVGEETSLDLKLLVEEWIAQEFCGELELDGELQPRLEGDFYAKIVVDGRSPDSVVCWDSGGFWLK